MNKKENDNNAEATVSKPKLRLVQAEEVAGLPNRAPRPPRARSQLTEQLSRYCDELDREIEKILSL